MKRIQKPSWQGLCTQFDVELALPDQDFLAAGHLFLSPVASWLVRVNAGPDGLVIRRFPWSIFYPVIDIVWSDLETVTEFGCRIRKYEITKTQSNSFITYKRSSAPNMMLPWCDEFNKLLPESIRYLDSKVVHWETAMLKQFDVCSNSKIE